MTLGLSLVPFSLLLVRCSYKLGLWLFNLLPPQPYPTIQYMYMLQIAPCAFQKYLVPRDDGNYWLA